MSKIKELADCANCEQPIVQERREGAGSWKRRFCSDKCRFRYYQKRYKNKLKKAVIAGYGGKCVCCGETREEFLSIDHLNGGGRKHRKAIKQDLYNLLIQTGYPQEDFRLLCMNCNFSRGRYGYCPHQKEVVNEDSN
jgi:hypothetical protein